MIYVGNVVRNVDHPLRKMLLTDGATDVRRTNRRVGRPRLDWKDEIMKHVVKSTDLYATVILNKMHWRKVVIKYCKNISV